MRELIKVLPVTESKNSKRIWNLFPDLLIHEVTILLIVNLNYILVYRHPAGVQTLKSHNFKNGELILFLVYRHPAGVQTLKTHLLLKSDIVCLAPANTKLFTIETAVSIFGIRIFSSFFDHCPST